MTMQAPASENPRLSAKEISEKFIALLAAMKSQNDLSLDMVQTATGISLLESNNKNSFGFSQKLNDDWFYALWYYPAVNGRKKGVRLDFNNETDRFADMQPVCSTDFERFHDALKGMGYSDAPIHGEIGQLQEWRYYKNDITISIIPEVKASPKDGSVFPTCVRSIGTLN